MHPGPVIEPPPRGWFFSRDDSMTKTIPACSAASDVLRSKCDPVTLEVLRYGLVAASAQMAKSIERSARSQLVREMLDYSAAIFDPQGGVIAQSARIPIHLNSMTRSLQTLLGRHYKLSDWRDGDVFAVNDPYSGGQHLPDIQTFRPVVHRGECIAVVGTLVHHLDVGGRARGSYAADATEIYQEGFRITPVRIVRQNVRDEVFFKLFAANIRIPETTLGDFDAQLAALSIGAGEVLRIVERYGIKIFLAGVQELIELSERRMRAAIRELPRRAFFAEDVVDGDGLDDQPLQLKVRAERQGEILEIDFSGSAPQVKGPVNCPLAATESATYYAVTAILGPGIVPNYGAYRPIRVIAPEGCVLNPLPPAPVVGRMVFSHRIANVVMSALSEAVPGRAVAPYYGNSNVYILSTGESRGQPQIQFEIEVGGWGARQGSDGPDCLSAGIHNLANNPIEMVENEFPLRMIRYCLRADSGGLGEYRGGLGAERSFMVLCDCKFSTQFDRVKFPVPGVAGGQPGAPARILVRHENKVMELPGKLLEYQLRAGDIVTILTQGGGGLGRPSDRKRELIEKDLKAGKMRDRLPGQAELDVPQAIP